MKLWGGRFRKETDDLVNDFNSSIQFDCRLYREDIQGSLAHAAMLADCGIISREDEAAIRAGLEGILADIEAGKVEFTADNEDIHMNVEALLTERIGAAGKRLHTARSRNDQVAVDLRLYLRREIGEIVDQILDLQEAILAKAKEHQNTVMPGYTHLQRAQPISFAQHLLAYGAMLRRDVGAAPGLPGADERVPPGQRGTGGDHLPHRPVGDRQGAGLYSAHGQQLRRSQRPGLCHRAPLSPLRADDAPEPLLRGDHPLVLLGV